MESIKKPYKPKADKVEKLSKVYAELKKNAPKVSPLFKGVAKVLFFSIFFASCSAQWHLKQAVKKNPNIITEKVIRQVAPFTPAHDLIPDNANLIDVVKSLAINQQCFVTILDRVGAIITLTDLEKPPMRMFLFGMITMIEMTMTEILRQKYPDDSWQELLSEKRVALAKKFQEERNRRGQSVELIDCLQFGDKGWIITYDEKLRKKLGHASRQETRKVVKELETLRNNLAHTQEIIPSGWQRIVIACSRWESNLGKSIDHYVDDLGSNTE